MNVKSIPSVVITDTGDNDVLFSRSTGIVEQNYTMGGFDAGKLVISDDNAHVLSLGTITAVNGLSIEADVAIDVTLNGSATPFPVIIPEGGTKGRLLADMAITSVSIKRHTGVTDPVNVIYAVWGDPVTPDA